MKFSPILFVVFVASAAWWPMADAVYVQSNSSELSARLLGSVDLPFEPPWFPSSVLRVQFWYRDFLSDKMYPRGWCGATVVSPRTLLTAAHCIRGVNKKLPDATYAIVFDELGKKFDDIYGVPIRHPEHNPIRHANDIAVVHLNKAITRPPVQLASAGTYTDKPLCRVIGFGGDGLTPSKRMQAIDVPLGSDEVCRLKRKIWDDVREMCTDDPEHKKKICKGDGGKFAVDKV